MLVESACSSAAESTMHSQGPGLSSLMFSPALHRCSCSQSFCSPNLCYRSNVTIVRGGVVPPVIVASSLTAKIFYECNWSGLSMIFDVLCCLDSFSRDDRSPTGSSGMSAVGTKCEIKRQMSFILWKMIKLWRPFLGRRLAWNHGQPYIEWKLCSLAFQTCWLKMVFRRLFTYLRSIYTSRY